MASLLRFNQPSESTFYVCACDTHIARNQDFITRDVKSALFRKVFNVRVNDDPKHHRQKDGCILGDVHCMNCNKILGFKFISVAKETPNQGFKEGRFILHLDRGLLYWNGKMTCNAQVVQPDAKNKGLIEFDQAAIYYFYVCRKCCTHIARCQDFAVKNGIHAWFENVTNVRTDGPESYRTEGTSTVANAYCSRCNLLLGTKVVSSEQPHPTLKDDRLLLKLHDLLYWNGSMMCDAEDLHPIGDSQHNYYFYL